MKLELKHLAPYLPYKLRCDAANEEFEVCQQNEIMVSIDILEELILIGNEEFETGDIKPILRPLSDLTKEIEVNGEKVVPIGVLSLFTSLEYCCGKLLEANIEGEMCETEVLHLSYYQIKNLFEWHFDLFGLIDKGLAIDINTFNK